MKHRISPRSPHTSMAAGRSIGWLLDARARERGNKTFLIWEPFDGSARVWTYASLAQEVSQVAAGLRRRGVAQGDFVLIHLDNCPEYVLTWFACAWLGAVAVCTNTRSSADELAYYAGHCGAKLAVTQPSYAELVARAIPDARAIIVTSPEGNAAPERQHCFAELLREEGIPLTQVNELAPAVLQYTSGTTGRPKAVVWSHANALWGGKVNAAHEGLTQDDCQLVYLPLFHTNAQAYSIMATLWVGASFVLQPRFSSSRFWQVSLRNRCTFSSQVYFALRALANMETPRRHHYRLWGTGICGHPIEAKAGVPTLGWWGMTETISHPIVGDIHVPNTEQTIGRAAPEYEIAVVDDEGRSVSPGETGNLLVRGVPGVSLFSGYLHDQAATDAAFDEFGWFITGDRVNTHLDGAISFADRTKDMLKVGAENVAASEIERVIMTVPGIAEVAVVGAPDPMLDEVPVAFIVPREGHSGLEQAVLAACREKLADFKVPRSVRVVAELPRATLEKVAKHKLREILQQEARLPEPRQTGS